MREHVQTRAGGGERGRTGGFQLRSRKQRLELLGLDLEGGQLATESFHRVLSLPFLHLEALNVRGQPQQPLPVELLAKAARALLGCRRPLFRR